MEYEFTYVRDSIYEAIYSEDVDTLMNLLQLEIEDIWSEMDEYLVSAIETGNMEIIDVVMENWPMNQSINIESDVFYTIPHSNHDENKSLEIMESLLPYCWLKGPDDDTYPIEDFFELTLYCCSRKKFILTEFFINNMYTEKHNSLYPLIKKLETAVDGWRHISVLLHDEIDYLEYRDIGKIGNILRARHFKNVAETFHKLLIKDTRESMELAVETFQALLDKNYHHLITLYVDDMVATDILKIEQVLKEPLITKLLFQLIYSSTIEKTQQKMYKIIDSLLWLCVDTNASQLNELSMRFLNPFISKPLRETATPEPQSDDAQSILRQENVFSLKEISRDVIRCKVFQNETNVKEFMDRIWEMKLPVTLKCFLLYIPDPAWMDDLQMS